MKLEPDYEQEYNAWKEKPNPQTTGRLLRKVQPAIDKGIHAHVGKQVSPVLRSSARKVALQAIRSYNPQQAKLGTHIINHMKGLRRIGRQQQQILRTPERVSLDQSFLAAAEAELGDRLGRSPSVTELADHTGLSVRRITKVRSYQQPVYEGSLLSMQQQGEDAGFLPAVEHSSMDVVTRAVYDDLDPINQQIMDWSLGLHGRKPLSNQEIAAKLKLTPGAVSQRKAIIQARLDEMEELELI